jgi:transcriptional regulator with PAS, ATPase and Fis domain
MGGKYNLVSIKDYVYKLCEVIREVLRVEVEIVDRSLDRIAGSGEHKGTGSSFVEVDNYLYIKALEGGKKLVIENPGYHRLCANCRRKYSCVHKFECCTPIKLDNQVIGVISLICFTDEQKKVILSKLKEYSDFLDMMSELIASKAKESHLEVEKESSISENKVSGDNRNLLDSIIGQSSCMEALKENIRLIAKGSANVLLTGESGSGKELFARAIHFESSRKAKPFIAVNCGAIPETLLESELFGYAPGAFTGASKQGKIGKFELANGGTIFLDEIGDMPFSMQVKLLRVLQEKVVIPVGSNKLVKFDARIISATNKDLEKLVKENSFREDLFYRLNVIPINIPPLRERKEDIPPLIKFLLDKYCSIYKKSVPAIAKDVMEVFLCYPWPGNVREMENVIEYLINITGDKEEIELCHIPYKIALAELEETISSEINLEAIEKAVIAKSLKIFGLTTEQKKNAAGALGISLASLYRKIDKYKLEA